ncbi:MAG: hypothetical protein FJ264_00695 [Planctomycetes bacterium]|nr:hypothetical protein [Planctomycetota bacterium]
MNNPSVSVIEKSRFHHFFLHHNNMDHSGFNEWVFYQGMLLNDLQKWWTNEGVRPSPHEGIDFCFYRDAVGFIRTLNKKTKIPALFSGKVVHIHNDFLGKSLYVQHNFHDEQGRTLFTIYGHVIPAAGLALRDILREGDILATVANVTENSKMLPHLHITVAWVSDSVPYENLDWSIINNPRMATLCNPIDFIDCKFTVEKEKYKPKISLSGEHHGYR